MASIADSAHDALINPTLDPAHNVSPIRAPLPDGDYHVLVPDDTYRAVVIGVEGFKFMRREARLSIWFELPDGTAIASYYPVKDLSKCGKAIRGRTRDPEFRVGWRSRLAKDLMTLFPERFSATCLPTSVPKIVMPVLISTSTVKKGSDGKLRPEGLWSSKVEAIVGWADRDADCGSDTDPGVDRNHDPGVDHHHDRDDDDDYYRFDDCPEVDQ